MRLLFLFLFLALTGWCVETVLTVDTAQPKALLPYQTFDQGASYDYRVNVKANGMRAALTGADAGVIQFASNGTSVAWAIFTSTSVNTNTGSFLIPIGPLAGPLGDGVYQVYLYNTNTPSRKYSVGGGSFRMEETTGFGSPTASYYLVPLNTDLVEQTGSNRFVRLSELGTDLGDWRLPVYSNQAAIAILNTGKLDVAVTEGWETGAHLNWLLSVPPLDYLTITNPPWFTTISSQSHAVLSNLTWTASGHSGTPARLAGFFEGGVAGYSYLGAGLYFGGSDELSVSNDIIAGAALGKTALQYEADTVALAALAGTNAALAAAIHAAATNEAALRAAALNGYKPTFCYDAADSNIFWAVVGGTNLVVWQVCSSNATAWRVASSSNGGQYVPGLEMYLSGSGIDEMNNNRPWATFTGANGAWIAFNPVSAGWLDGWWVMDVSTCPFSTLNGNSSDIDAASLSCSWWSEESSGEIYLVRFSYPVVVTNEIAAIHVPDLSDPPTFAQIAASNALPYTAWTGAVTPADGTATVAIAHGNMPVLVTDAPCVLTLDPTGYGTGGVSRVSLSYYPGTNSFTFATNVITYAETPTVDTSGWNTLLIRRVSDGAWKGVGL